MQGISIIINSIKMLLAQFAAFIVKHLQTRNTLSSIILQFIEPIYFNNVYKRSIKI